MIEAYDRGEIEGCEDCDDCSWRDVEIENTCLRELNEVRRQVLEEAMTLYWALKKYEDTGLTPNEVEQLKGSQRWFPVEERLPEDDNYILLSFENFDIPLIGKYEADADGGGVFYLGNNDEGDTCLSQNLFVNAWMPLTEPYQEEGES